ACPGPARDRSLVPRQQRPCAPRAVPGRTAMRGPSRILLPVAVGLCVVASALSARLALQSPDGEAVLVAGDPDRDLGDVAQDETVPAEFTLGNPSRTDLTLQDVQASCSCLVPDFSPVLLKAGATTRLTVTFRSGVGRGPVAGSVLVRYRHPEEPRPRQLALTLRANVIPDYDVEPLSLAFGADRPVRQSVTLAPRNLKDLRVSGCGCT